MEPLGLKIVQMSYVVHVDERAPYAAGAVSVKQKGISVSLDAHCVVEGNVRWTQIDWVGTNKSILADLTNIYVVAECDMAWEALGRKRQENGHSILTGAACYHFLRVLIPRQSRVVTV